MKLPSSVRPSLKRVQDSLGRKSTEQLKEITRPFRYTGTIAGIKDWEQ